MKFKINDCGTKIELFEDAKEKAQREMAYKIEEYIRLRIQPKPKWMPEFLWHRILKRVLILEMFKGGIPK